MEAIGLFSFLVSCIIGLVLFLAIMKIFSISHDIGVIKKNIVDFTKYYYQLQDFKNAKDTMQPIAPVTAPKIKNFDPAIFDKAIDEKLSLQDYEVIYERDREKFMNIANFFFKNDTEFYNREILPIMKNNRQ